MSTHELLQPLAKSTFRRFGKIAALGVLATAALSTAEALVMDTGTLSIAPTGFLDVENNNLIVRSGSLATLTGYITTGLYNGTNGYWDGPGINSSNAAGESLTGIGILDNSVAGYTDWPPLEPVSGLSGTEILIKYTWWGDSDLNGVVDGVDYSLIDVGFGGQLDGWVFGDYSYDGVIDGVDYSLIDVGFGGQSGPLSPSGAVQGVPEPSSVILASLGLLFLAGRRKLS